MKARPSRSSSSRQQRFEKDDFFFSRALEMTSRDVRDILSLPARQTGQAGGQAPAKKRPKARAPRGDGITRELYALMGDNAPPLALAALRRPGLREQFMESGKREAARWKMAGFTNEARGDGLRLRHWVRESDEPESSQQRPSSLPTSPRRC